METQTFVPPTISPRHFSKLDQTIINLIIQQAFLKLTSNTAYLNVLYYCLSRMEQLHDIRIVVIDHITTQDNRSNLSSNSATRLYSNNVPLDDPKLKQQYFSCTPHQLEQACDMTSDNLSYLNKCLDHPLIGVATVDSIMRKILRKGWLKKRQFDQDLSQTLSSDPSNQNGLPNTEAKVSYRFDFIQLLDDLQTIGYDVMVLQNTSNEDAASLHSSAKDSIQVG